ncbi:hypothetical protein LTR37_020960 [Vermiconidia calcicola]|uniref:Uncharacterized protein n=1 Tax=Vermiconidia calcicola TaxID=1690605 RepID=A0ACC3MAZ9_9PEZI|nr:hypothetical protein LTR37_020960 [Vermiconidia calcicola]
MSNPIEEEMNHLILTLTSMLELGNQLESLKIHIDLGNSDMEKWPPDLLGESGSNMLCPRLQLVYQLGRFGRIKNTTLRGLPRADCRKRLRWMKDGTDNHRTDLRPHVDLDPSLAEFDSRTFGSESELALALRTHWDAAQKAVDDRCGQIVNGEVKKRHSYFVHRPMLLHRYEAISQEFEASVALKAHFGIRAKGYRSRRTSTAWAVVMMQASSLVDMVDDVSERVLQDWMWEAGRRLNDCYDILRPMVDEDEEDATEVACERFRSDDFRLERSEDEP